VHLARCANGDAALLDFLISYREHPPGIDHDLVVVLKGYEQDSRSRQLALDALLPYRALTLEIPDEGLDLDAYRSAVNAFEYSYYCFLNSFSRPSRGDWLNAMMHWAQQPGVGIVGATGSYQSFFTDYIDAFNDSFRYHLRKILKGARFNDGSKGWSREGPANSDASDHQQKRMRLWKKLFRAAGSYSMFPFRCMRALLNFAAFPNAHIRTNGFVLSRHVIDRLRWPAASTKLDAYALESGRSGITAQIVGMGLEAVVVGRDGRGYLRPEWQSSGTFWQRDQENLLISDNQSREYDLASSDRRRRLCRHAWQDRAAPSV